MYADRDRYVADPAFVPVPVAAMLDPAYVGRRAELIGAHAGPPPAAGELDSAPRAADRTLEAAGTSHFVVVDAWGNVAAMTTSVESVFGSGRSVGGFMLNNQLTDFSFDPVGAETASEHRVFLLDKRLQDALVAFAVKGMVEQIAGAVVLREQHLDVSFEIGVGGADL
jgi:gamma-glutamyltranspeptidase/glutathione hydrolase